MSVISGLESWTGALDWRACWTGVLDWSARLEYWSTGVLECQTKRLKIVLTGGASTDHDKHIVNCFGAVNSHKKCILYFFSERN